MVEYGNFTSKNRHFLTKNCHILLYFTIFLQYWFRTETKIYLVRFLKYFCHILLYFTIFLQYWFRTETKIFFAIFFTIFLPYSTIFYNIFTISIPDRNENIGFAIFYYILQYLSQKILLSGLLRMCWTVNLTKFHFKYIYGLVIKF